jgi:hypothetical protein
MYEKTKTETDESNPNPGFFFLQYPHVYDVDITTRRPTGVSV